MEWKVNDMNDVELNRLIQSSDPSNAFSTMRSLMVIKQSEIIAAIENSKVTWFRRLWANASRLKKMFISCIAVLLFGVFGTTSTLVARNSLSDIWVKMIDDSCSVSGANARMVKSGVDSLGTITEYWTVESKDSVLDAIVRKGKLDGSSGGSFSCDQKPRKVGEPLVGYAGYSLNDSVERSSFFGWIPPNSVGVLELRDKSLISIHPDANGNFLALADGLQIPVLTVRLTIYDSNRTDPMIINLQPKESHGK
jgi:hypothetical protein